MELGSGLPKEFLLDQDTPHCLTAIHDRHADVCENHAVANVAALLLHIHEVHVKHLLSIADLVAPEAVGVREHLLNRGVIEDDVIGE